MSATIEVEQLTKRFKDVTAVKEVTLSAREGRTLGILGPSGAGKSTLLRMMDFLEVPDEGTVAIRGEIVDPLSKKANQIRRSIGMVLQKPVVLNRSVAHNLSYSLELRDWDSDKISERVEVELKRLGLLERRQKNARTLSGGEMQRLSFARATIFDPEILLLDEFAANLDPRNVALLEGMIRQYAAVDRRRTIVMVTHNIFQAKRMCDWLALMWDGEVIEVAEKTKFFDAPEDKRTEAFLKGDLIY